MAMTLVGASWAGAAASTVPSVVDYAQCANGAPPSTSLACPSGWINGTLQSTNSHYREDDVVPQRVMVSVPAAGSGTTHTHTFTFRYMARKDNVSAHAYDSLSTWNLTQTALTNSTTDRCAGLRNVTCPTSPATTYPIPTDTTDVYPVGTGISPTTSAHERPGVMTMFGGTITAVSAPTHDHPIAGTGDDYATITISYTVPTSTSAQNVQLLFGGHLAAGFGPRGWGAGLGASSVSGGPYHIKWDGLDGTSVGNRDNQIQAGAIAALPAAFTIQKTANPTVAAPGGIVQYTVTLTNTGQLAGSVTFTDSYQQGVTILNDATHPLPAGCTNDAGTRLLTCTVGPIAAGSAQSISYYAQMPASFPDDTYKGLAPCTSTQFRVHNTATITSPNTGASSADVCVTAAPHFTIDKVANPTVVDFGGSVNYTVTITNDGTAPGTSGFTDTYRSDVTITQWPNGCTNTVATHTLSCTTDELAPGASQQFTYTAQMPTNFTTSPGGNGCDGTTQFDVHNTAVLPDGTSDSADVCVNAVAHFTGTKSVTPSTTTPGGIVQYTVTVTNDGHAPGSTTTSDTYASGVTILNDATHPFPAACHNDTATRTITCNTGRLNPGQTVSFVYYAQMPATFNGQPGGDPCTSVQFDVENTVVIGTETHVADVCVDASPTFVPSKSASPSTGVAPGGTVTYTVVIANNGSSGGSTTYTDTYQAGVVINDATLPNGCNDNVASRTITCNTGPIAAGSSVRITYQATMPTSFPDSTYQGLDPCSDQDFRVRNTVTVAVGGRTATSDVCVTARPRFTKSKTVSPTGPVNPGASVTYTLTVGNTGSAPGTVTVTDHYADGVTITSFPADCRNDAASNTLTCSTTLAPGASHQFVYVARMPDSYTGSLGGSGCTSTQLPVVNSVTFSTGGTASTVVVCVNMPILTLVKSACTANPIPTNGQLSYTLTYSNAGSAPATNTVLVDTVPAGSTVIDNGGGQVATSGGVTTVTWQIGTVAVNTSGSRSFTVAVNPDKTSGQLVNSATITSTETSDTSNTVTNGVGTNGLAAASGDAYGVSVRLLGGGLLGPVPETTNGSTSLLTLPAALLPYVGGSLFAVGNTSSVTATGATDDAAAEAAGVNVSLGGVVTVSAKAVVARVHSFATGSTAGSDTGGSEVLGLTINGKSFGDVSNPRVITVVNLLGIPVAEVDVLEETNRSGAAIGGALGAQPQSGIFNSGMTVNGLHVKVLGTTLEAIVSHAESKAAFPTLTPCSSGNAAYVIGSAVNVDANVASSVGFAHVAVNPIILPSTGGAVNATVNALAVPALALTADTVSDHTDGALSPIQAHSSANVQNLRLGTAITAQAVGSAASAGPPTGATTILNLKIGTLDACEALGFVLGRLCSPPPNSVLIDLTRTLKIVLNEQIVSQKTITVNAIHIYVLGAGNPLGLPVGSDVVISGSTAGTS